MLDADDRFPEAEGANIIRLGHTLDALGCAHYPLLQNNECVVLQPGHDRSLNRQSW